MADIIIRIGAESKQFQEELDKIRGKTEDLEGQLSTIAKISGVAFAALTAEAALAIKAFAESEAATRELTLAMQNQGVFSEELSEAYRKQAESLQELTGIDDDAITKGQSLLQTFIGQTEISNELSQAMADLSIRTGSVESAAEILGRSINGNTRGLKQFGIEIDDNLTKQERMAQIIEKVNVRMGGQAEAANKGLGSIKGLTTAFGNFQEAIGERLAPIVTLVTQKITAFFTELNKNKPLLDLIVGIGVAAGVITGLITFVSAAGIALIGLKATMTALGLTSALALGPIGLVVGAVIALGVAAGIYAVSNKKATTEIDALNNKISETEKKITDVKAAIVQGRPEFFGKNPQQELKALNNELDRLMEKQTKLSAREFAAPGGAGDQEAKRKAAADKATSEQRLRESSEVSARKAHTELLNLQQENASSDLIEIKKKEAEILKSLTATTNSEERAALLNQLEDVNTQKTQAVILAREQQEILREDLLANNEEFQEMTSSQQDQFIEANQSQLLGSIENDRSIRQQGVLDRTKLQIASNNQFLADQAKFGTAFATINKAMHSEVFLGSKQAFGELAQLQTSSNATLKGIGKAAAVANIIIKTAESAMSIYAGFSTIPIVGPALGIAGAAAAIAFGAEQVGRVTAAQQGGLITGGIPGRDSVPAMLTPGELIVPSKNFADVVNAVAAQKNQDTKEVSTGVAGIEGIVGININFEGEESEKVITARQVEARALGTLRSA